PGAELRGQVQVAHDLGQGETAHVTVVGGESALLEHRMREQVGRRGGHDQAGLLQGPAEISDLLVPLRAGRVEVEHVVVVEVHPVGAELGELAHRPVSGHGRPYRGAEYLHSLPSHGPYAERKAVSGSRNVSVCAHWSVLSFPWCRGLTKRGEVVSDGGLRRPGVLLRRPVWPVRRGRGARP